MSSTYCPLPVMKRKSSRRRTGAPMPVLVMVSSPPVRLLCRLPELARAHGCGARRYGFDDIVVAGAAADVAFELFADGAFVELSALSIHDVDRGHDHAGRAVAALQRVMLAEGLLHRMELAVLREPFNRQNV